MKTKPDLLQIYAFIVIDIYPNIYIDIVFPNTNFLLEGKNTHQNT